MHDAVLKGWDNLDQFRPGTNLRAWLFTILRNQHYSELRKRQREVEDVDGMHAERLATQPSQFDHVRLAEFRDAFQELNVQQREALFLVGACGFSTAESAAICGCAEGTVKSRVNRARVRLTALLYLDEEDELPQDAVMAAATASHGTILP